MLGLPETADELARARAGWVAMYDAEGKDVKRHGGKDLAIRHWDLMYACHCGWENSAGAMGRGNEC